MYIATVVLEVRHIGWMNAKPDRTTGFLTSTCITMRTFRLLGTAFLLLLVAAACKKDKGEEKGEDDGQLVYDGSKYNIEKGLVWDYADNFFSTHYSQSYYLKNGKEFSSWGTQTLGPNDPPITVYYVLCSPGTSKFQNGVFKYYHSLDYASWQVDGLPEAMKNEFLCVAGYVCFDANGDRKIAADEAFRVSSGTVTVTDSYTEYNLELENGKKLTGRNSASLTKTLPPS